ncbi:MAG: AMP-binding protein [Pseudomonadota bacterium]
MRTEDLLMPTEMLAKRATEHPDKVYLRQPMDGDYVETSWGQVFDRAKRIAAGLYKIGLKKGDKVSILAGNCDEWFIVDFAISLAGMVSVPIYATAGQSTVSYVLDHSEAKAIVLGRLPKPEDAEAALAENPEVASISMALGTIKCKYTLQQLIDDNDPIEEIHVPDLEETFSIVYTSGSTGKPKGVVLTYRNIAFQGDACTALLMGRSKQERLISYLPLAHVTERGVIEYSSLYGGAEVTFNESLETFIDDLRNAKVTAFISVPRLWVKFQSEVLSKLPQEKLDRMLRIPIVGGMVKRKIRAQLGLAHVRSCGSGSAPISEHILEWYRKLGINISEGWGMTELGGMATTQYPFRRSKLGTIGKPLNGLEVKVSDEGELLIKGDGVFQEYYKNPEVTSETFTEDGFMRTGDKVDLDKEGYLKITGRVKDLFKSGKGKYIAPVPIESKLASNLLIDQMCVMGSGLPKAMCVLVLSAELADNMSKDEIEASLEKTLDEVNASIEKHEVVGGIIIANEAWTIDNGMLTPTLKIKRAELEAKYKDLISQSGLPKISWQ